MEENILKCKAKEIGIDASDPFKRTYRIENVPVYMWYKEEPV